MEVSERAPVAQRIEQLPSKQTVAGSNPAWGAIAVPATWKCEFAYHIYSDIRISSSGILTKRIVTLVIPFVAS